MAQVARAWIVAAHPDDEVIGASALLSTCRDVLVVHVTNGAPRDSRWWPTGVATRDAYIRQRDREADRALAMVGARRLALGIDDQQAVFEIDAISRMLAHVLEHAPPDLIVTHAYEGGHPDHDSVAVAVARARQLAGSRSLHLEMALYHGAGGVFRAGEFIEPTASIAVPLTAAQLARRRELLETYESQLPVLVPFLDVAVERYRVAPHYELSAAPHAGPLYYEQLGMSPPAVTWRALVGALEPARRTAC